MNHPLAGLTRPAIMQLLLRAGVVAVGALLIVAGVLMLVLPGPGILAIALGLGLLGREFPRARRLADQVRDRASGVRAWAAAKFGHHRPPSTKRPGGRPGRTTAGRVAKVAFAVLAAITALSLLLPELNA